MIQTRRLEMRGRIRLVQLRRMCLVVAKRLGVFSLSGSERECPDRNEGLERGMVMTYTKDTEDGAADLLGPEQGGQTGAVEAHNRDIDNSQHTGQGGRRAFDS